MSPGFKQNQTEKVILVGTQLPGERPAQAKASFEELKGLAYSAGAIVTHSLFQSLKKIYNATLIGKGKIEEIAVLIEQNKPDLIVVDADLSPAQNRNLEEIWKIRVIDREALILDIFAKRARTKAGKLQVELAQLQYLQPRLRGMWQHFGQQKGGIGLRGPGETQLEVDRRRLGARISRIKKRLSEVEKERLVHKSLFQSVPMQLVSFVGYTNAGKSTLFNRLSNAQVFVEDKLFATLDPTIRRIELPSRRPILIADTVGFIRKLPHHLVESFKTTFEELAHAHLLVLVLDFSDPEHESHLKVIHDVLADLNLDKKPMILVLNKIDQVVEKTGPLINEGLPISAAKGFGLEELLKRVDEVLRTDYQKATLLLPYPEGNILAKLHEVAHIEVKKYLEEGVLVVCELQKKHWHQFRKYQA